MNSSAKNHDRKGVDSAVFFLTFACYGSHLPGQTGSVDDAQNRFGSPLRESNARLQHSARRAILQPPYLLDRERRDLVLRALRKTCDYRSWILIAAHVRTSHVHVVIEADQAAEQVLNTLKAYAGRALNQLGLDGGKRRHWGRHGSTRHLWTTASIKAAVGYVVSGQGEPMALWQHPNYRG